ncbi:CBS domain-containing protein [Lipingzhangella sp. LS1_29]|uniref:CBS domain-containing protein n=1 Tax=Lipingzhangella rawalii TaxID=2055835 RepID=A0ABU2H9A3_9ACTN|nr:CBS domain-containing protein [Lipingzhangella rawalii]MDS1271873.1 CBS domain-containing protein [Lipingzhangella rawalii]
MTTIVRDVMTRNVTTVAPEATFKDLAEHIVNDNLTALPVIQGHRLVGLVSETDLLRKEEYLPGGPDGAHGESLRSRLRRLLRTGSSSPQTKAQAHTAREVMTTDVVTVSPEDTVVFAARMIDRYDVRQLPVLDEHAHLVGLVSRRDLLRVFVRPDEDIRQDLESVLATAPPWLDTDRLSYSVEDGMVTLEGVLEQRSHCVTVTQMVRTVDGLVGIQDRLTWITEDMLPPSAPRPI